MQFTHDIGIVATKAELKAILGFAKDSDDAKISFRVQDGKLVAWAASSIAAVYHHGLAFDGKGKPATEDNSWHVTVDILRRIERGMTSKDEVVLHVNRALHFTEAEVRTIEDSQSMTRTSLDGHGSEQIDLSLPNTLPTRPDRYTGEIPTSKLTLGMTTLLLLKDVAKAVGTEANRFYITSNASAPVYVEVDKPSVLNEEDQAAWVCVLVPMTLNDDSPVEKAVDGFRRKVSDFAPDVTVEARIIEPNESDPVVKILQSRQKKTKNLSKSERTEEDLKHDVQTIEDFEETEA